MIEIDEISSDVLKSWLLKGKVVLVDVREEQEYKEQSIPGAYFLPMSNFDPKEVPFDPNKELVFYCRSGRRSYEAALTFKEDFPQSNPLNLEHGIIGWVSQGGTIV